MRDKLQAFLEGFSEKPVEWGRDDCSAVCALWARENGFDIHLPHYTSQDEAHAIIDAAGGLMAVWDEVTLEGDLPERDGAPELGDVGIIDTRRFGPIGVIWGSGGTCCWRTNSGFFWLAPRSHLKVWAIT